jgi:hypothetical protein
MTILYHKLDDSAEKAPDEAVEGQIQRGIKWIQVGMAEAEKAVFLVDVSACREGVYDRVSKILGYVPGSLEIHHTDNAIRGVFPLPDAIENLSEDQLRSLSNENSDKPTMFKIEMLARLQSIVKGL